MASESSNCARKTTPRPIRACDTCRKRKVKCDKNLPCSNCKVHGFECIFSKPVPRAPRRKQWSFKEYKEKPDETRQESTGLEETRPAISNLPSPPVSISQAPIPVRDIASAIPISNTIPEPVASSTKAEAHVFEGESSLHAHSVAARELFELALKDNAFAARNPEMTAAMSSLRQIASRDRSNHRAKEFPITRLPVDNTKLSKLELPPVEAVLAALRRANDNPTLTFSFPLAYVPLKQATELCKNVFFNVTDYSTTTAILVHATLYNLFMEFKWTAKDEPERAEFAVYAAICRTNLECSISNLELLLPATFEVIQALLIAASFALDISKLSICKKLTAIGCSLAQALGWHRFSSMKDDDPDTQKQKLVMYWTLYIFDKSMSLRLGQASTMQDYDIDVPMPTLPKDNPYSAACDRMLHLWAAQARIQSLIYEKLYSPGALRQSDAVRMQCAKSLITDCDNMMIQFSTHKVNPRDTGPPSKTRESSASNDEVARNPSNSLPIIDNVGLFELLGHSDDVIYSTMLTMIHRGMPDQTNEKNSASAECLRTARNALQRHQSCTQMYKSKSEDMWSMYLHWTIFNAPFIPFTVVFCNVLTTCSRSDLTLLEQFVESLSGSATSEGTVNMLRLTSLFYRVARLYVESKEQEKSTNPQLQSGQPQGDIQQIESWMNQNTYLNAFGFSGDLLGDLSGMGDLGEWFSGNQHMMGLLENDLSYLDQFPMP